MEIKPTGAVYRRGPRYRIVEGLDIGPQHDRPILKRLPERGGGRCRRRHSEIDLRSQGRRLDFLVHGTENDLVPQPGNVDPTDPAGGFDLLVAQQDCE
jgi:hypothetical protein